MTTTYHATRPVTPRNDVERFIWYGVATPNGGASLHWRVDITQGDEHDVWRALTLAGPYNDFQPDDVYDVLHAYRDNLMRIELAREGSLAVYCYPAIWPNQTLAARWDSTQPAEPGSWLKPGQPLNPDEQRAAMQALAGDMHDARADERSYQTARSSEHHWLRTRGARIEPDHTPTLLRFWWD